jgi:hypothetical protein
MTSQRDETTHTPAGQDMADDPIVIERRDEVPTGDSADGDGRAGDALAGDSLADGVPGGEDPDGGPAAEGRPGYGRPGYERAGYEPAGHDRPGAGVAAEDEMASDDLTGRHAAPDGGGNGVPAAALSEQQWPVIQAMFVDDPQGSVQRAAAAAEEVAKAFVASLQREQAALRASWETGGDTTTEDLRTALQQYRAFCGRLEGLA